MFISTMYSREYVFEFVLKSISAGLTSTLFDDESSNHREDLPSYKQFNTPYHTDRELFWIKELGTAMPYGCNDNIKGVGKSWMQRNQRDEPFKYYSKN